ncbi:MAG: GNAT family N-acetyltransferase [Pikeienuella sp.]
MEIRDAVEADLGALRAILNPEIRESTATWTTVERSAGAMRKWWMDLRRDGYPTLVACDGAEILGYACYGRFRTWPGYWRTAENSVYVARSAQRRGVGRALLSALVKRAEYQSLSHLVGVIGADREASLALHRACGFTEVGRLPGVGAKFGEVLDMVMMQRALTPR